MKTQESDLFVNPHSDTGSKPFTPDSLIRDDPVRQAKTGFSIDLKRDQHVK
jgi:hypothetical protein